MLRVGPIQYWATDEVVYLVNFLHVRLHSEQATKVTRETAGHAWHCRATIAWLSCSTVAWLSPQTLLVSECICQMMGKISISLKIYPRELFFWEKFVLVLGMYTAALSWQSCLVPGVEFNVIPKTKRMSLTSFPDIILCRTGNQWRLHNICVMWSYFRVSVINRAAAYWTLGKSRRRFSVTLYTEYCCSKQAYFIQTLACANNDCC